MSHIQQSLVQGSELLTDRFHGWPTFHDSEVLELTLRRDPFPTLILRVTAFQTTPDVDEAGYFRRINECVVTMEFYNIQDLQVEDFNEQNVLAEILLVGIDGGLQVSLAGLYGMQASFKCASARVPAVVYKNAD